MTLSSGKLIVLIFTAACFLVTGNVYAQSGNNTATDNEAAASEPEITINTGFATFSYGVVYVGIEVKNAIPDLTGIEIEYYNPDGELEGSRSETLSIHNGTGSFSCYCFGVEREYVEESYEVIVIYGDNSQTDVMPPFSSAYPQPPSISFHAADQNNFGIHIGGRVSGGIAGEQVDVAIYPQDGDSPLWSKTIGSNTKVIFDTSLPNSEAETLLPTGTYRVVATHLATGTTGETMLIYTNPSSPDVAEPEPTAKPEPTREPLPRETELDEGDEQEELIEDNDSDGTIRSPFIFEDENDNQIISASLSTVSNTIPQASIEDTLVINGTLASHYLVHNITAQETAGMAQIYILSGNWSMAVNSTTVKDFAANFTVVREDGEVRSAYSFANFDTVNASDVGFEQDSMMLASTADVQKDSNATKAQIMITIEKMSVIKIEFGNDPSRPLGRPIYGVVDSLVLVSGGERSVMPR